MISTFLLYIDRDDISILSLLIHNGRILAGRRGRGEGGGFEWDNFVIWLGNIDKCNVSIVT